jgi:hypothetical protein
MTVYTDAFTASNIYPSEISYGFIALTALNPAITLGWPEETSTYGFLANGQHHPFQQQRGKHLHGKK